MTDLFAFDLEDGFASGDCALCHALAQHMRRWLDAFRREGRQDAAARKRFYAGGGLCPRHSWELHALVAADGSGAPIADVYGRLAEHDLALLERLQAGRRPRGGAASALRAEEPCFACVEEAEALPRKAEFLLELLSAGAGRGRYERAAPVCRPHLVALVAAAEGREELVRYLLDERRRRTAEVRARLAEYNRKRDHRFAADRREDEERSWTDVIRLFAGPGPRGAGREA